MTVRAFRSTPFGVGVSPQSLGVPAAAYPGRVATSADLIVAVDRQQTRLALPLNSSDTQMTVTDPSVIVAYNLLSIDNEIVKTTGPAAGNVVPISRAFDGTAAATHLASSIVSGFIDAYHHNALVAEVQAIEQTLGANLSNVPAVAFVVSTAYKFAPQAPGGALTVGNNVITLAPVPAGVNGSDTNHYLYISGGTGTAEAVLITGGTAVAGGASGTLIVNCANAHSGAWTIQSATAGIQEAVKMLETAGTGGTVFIPAGNHLTYATITIHEAVTLTGGSMASVVFAQTNYGDILYFDANAGTAIEGGGVSHLYIASTVTRTSGAAIRVGTSTGTGGWRMFAIETINFVRVFVGIQLDSCFWSSISDVLMFLVERAGLLMRGLSTTAAVGNISIRNLIVGSGARTLASCYIGSRAEGIYVQSMILEAADITGAAHLWVTDPELGPGTSPKNLFFDQLVCDTSGTRGAQLDNTLSVYFTNSWFTSSAQEGVALAGQTGGGVTQDIRFSTCRFIGNGREGLHVINGWDVWVDNSLIDANGGAAANTYSGIKVEGSQSQIHIRANLFARVLSGSSHKYSVEIGPGNGDGITVLGNNLSRAVTGPILNGATGKSILIKQNLGIDDIIPIIASAGSVTLPENELITITGTVPIANLAPLRLGRQVDLIFTDIAPGGVVSGGNIVRTQTAVQNQRLTLRSNGSGWY